MAHDTATGEVVAGLRAWAKGSYPIEAAAELLIRACGGRLLTGPWIRPLDHDGWFWIDVERPTDAGALSGADKRVFDLVASLAFPEYPVSLNHALPGLDRDNLELVLAAVAHAAGSHQQSRIITAYPGPTAPTRQSLRRRLRRSRPWEPVREPAGETEPVEETRGGVMAEHTDKQTNEQTNGLIEEPAELFTVVTVTYPQSSLAGGARCHWIKAPITTMNGDGDGEQAYWYLLGSDDGSGYHWQDVVLGAEQVTVEALPAPAVDPARDPAADRPLDPALDRPLDRAVD